MYVLICKHSSNCLGSVKKIWFSWRYANAFYCFELEKFAVEVSNKKLHILKCSDEQYMNASYSKNK